MRTYRPAYVSTKPAPGDKTSNNLSPTRTKYSGYHADTRRTPTTTDREPPTLITTPDAQHNLAHKQQRDAYQRD
jgi:hypothetical protein